MSEIDTIIIGTLKQLGCVMDDTVKGLDDMSTDLIFESVERCLSNIQPSFNIIISSNLPQNMATRFKLGTRLAECVKLLGYRGEVGYDKFLYSNISDMRKIFMFLMDKLPKEQTILVKEDNLSPIQKLRKLISQEMSRILTQPIILSKVAPSSCHCHLKFNATRLLLPNVNPTNSTFKKYYNEYMSPFWNQIVDSRDLIASVLQMNALNSISQALYNSANTTKNLSVTRLFTESVQMESSKNTQFKSTHVSKLQINNIDLPVEENTHNMNVLIEPAKQENEDNSTNIEFLKNDLLKLIEELKLKSLQIDPLNFEIKSKQARKNELESTFGTKRDEIEKKKKLLLLLPGVNENLEKLKVMSEAQTKKLAMLNSQWSTIKSNLQDEYETVNKNYIANSSETMRMKSLVDETEQEIINLTSEAEEKEHLFQQLNTFKKSNYDSGRSQYTDRILEIVENIKKQNIEIEKVLSETRILNKDVDNLSGILERTYLVTDELVFKDAKNEPTAKKTYKLLASLHENFAVLRKSIDSIGQVKREISDLEEQLEGQIKANVSMNLEKASEDLKAIKQENKILIEKIKIKLAR